MPLSAGERFGAYEILAPIGAGGMGEVYRARDTKLKRDVALKVLPEAFARDPGRMARFQREAEVLASLSHPNIAHIYGVEERALVMELVEGESPKGPMPFEDAWKIALQMADALEYAHERGVVHRDLKPANVKVTPEGVVKLLDFGLAKAYSDSPESTGTDPENSPTMTLGGTMAGAILGTAAYMSPEQARGKKVDKRADIWSWGVVLYELLTGEQLFQGEDAAETLAAVIHKQPELGLVPLKARRLLNECLQKDPSARLRNIGTAKYLLADYAGSPSNVKRSKMPWAVASLAILAALVIGYIHFREAPLESQVLKATILPPDGTSYVFSNITGPPALSPDGRRVVFAARSTEGKQQLWVRPLDSTLAQPLPGTERAQWPFWSPDGRYVGFFGSDNKLKKIDLSGGPPVTIGNANEERVGGASWSTAGAILFGNIRSRPLARVFAAGGAPSPLTALNGDERGTVVLPQFLPDGHYFLFHFRNNTDTSSIRVGSLDRPNQPAKVVVENAAQGVYSLGHLLFLRETTLMAQPFDLKRLEMVGEAVPLAEGISLFGPSAGNFTVSNTGVLIYQQASAAGQHRIVWLDRSGKELGTVGDPGVALYDIALSPDQKSLALTSNSRGINADLWMFDLARGIKTRFTSNPAVDSDAVWSPNGKTIVWYSKRKGPMDLFRKASDGSGTDELLYTDAFDKRPRSWSPDGRFILYERTGDTPGTHLWVLPLTPEQPGGSLKPHVFLESQFDQRTGMFSPDGKWVVYSSNESGESEIYITPFPGPGAKHQISSGGGLKPRWRRDGKEIFYLTPDGELAAAEVAFHDGTLQVRRVQTLFGGICATNCGTLYDVSNDGQRVIVAERGAATSPPLTVVQNWPALLKK